MNEHESGEHWGGHPHRHRGEGEGRRTRSRPRFGPPPGFGGGAFEGGPELADGPEFDRGPDFGGPEFGGFAGPAGLGRGPGFRGGPGPHVRPGFPGGPPGWPMPQGFGPWRGRGRRISRAKRGDLRAAALALLAEEPMNGYQIIQQIRERSGGLWQPSPGSVYPALAQLEDENLISAQPADGARRAYALTDEGRAYVAAHPDELRAPWSAMAGDGASAIADMKALVGQLHLAAFQVVSAGTEAQLGQARKVLAQARRALYRILAEDEPTADDEAGSESASASDARPEQGSGHEA